MASNSNNSKCSSNSKCNRSLTSQVQSKVPTDNVRASPVTVTIPANTHNSSSTPLSNSSTRNNNSSTWDDTYDKWKEQSERKVTQAITTHTFVQRSARAQMSKLKQIFDERQQYLLYKEKRWGWSVYFAASSLLHIDIYGNPMQTSLNDREEVPNNSF